MDYSKLTLHIAVSDIFDEDEAILYGFAIKAEEETSFLIDLEQLVRRHGGVPFDELLMQDDNDEASTASIRHHKNMSKEHLRDAIIDVVPVDEGSVRRQRRLED